MDVIDISVAKKYTDDTVAGAGAVAGKPCQIQSITDITGGHRVTFLWVDNSSVSHTSTMDVMDGEKGDDGLGIKSVAVNSSNHLIVTYDDDTTEDAGEITLDTSDFVQKSSTAGLLKNDGTVDTNTYALASALNDKVDKVTGKGLSTNDYDNTAKTKLDGLANIKSVGTGLSLNGTTGELTATGGSGGGTWGSITGTLSDQTDLQTALDGKQATLTFDNVPTNGSNNPVKSDGIYDAINDVYGVIGETGAVNIANCTAASQTNSGVTITKNSDNSYTLNGTSTGGFSIALTDIITFSKPAYLSGCAGGTRDTFALQYTNGTDVYWQYDAPVYMPTAYTNAKIFLLVRSGITFNNTVIRPMVSYAVMPYHPYAMTNRELTEREVITPTFQTNFSNSSNRTKIIRKGSQIIASFVVFSTGTVTTGVWNNNMLKIEGYGPGAEMFVPFITSDYKTGIVKINPNGMVQLNPTATFSNQLTIFANAVWEINV